MNLTHAGMIAALMMAAPLSAHEPAPKASLANTLSATAREAAATVDAFHDALARGDTTAAAALLADDALIFEEGGVEWSKAEYVASHLPADAAFSQVVGTKVSRRSGDANGAFAWIATEGRMTGTYKGKAVDRVTTETMLLHHIGSAWRVVHIHWSSAAAHD